MMRPPMWTRPRPSRRHGSACQIVRSAVGPTRGFHPGAAMRLLELATLPAATPGHMLFSSICCLPAVGMSEPATTPLPDVDIALRVRGVDSIRGRVGTKNVGDGRGRGHCLRE